MIEYEGKEVVLMVCFSCNIKRYEHCYISYNGDRKSENLFELSSYLNKKYNVYINGI